MTSKNHMNEKSETTAMKYTPYLCIYIYIYLYLSKLDSCIMRSIDIRISNIVYKYTIINY